MPNIAVNPDNKGSAPSAYTLYSRLWQALERNPIHVETMTMGSPHTDKVFTGSIPRLYETHLVPLIFEPYAADLANRLALRTPPGCSRLQPARVSRRAVWRPFCLITSPSLPRT